MPSTLVDLALARRLEAIDVQAGLACVEILERLRPAVGATALEIAGGVVVYAGEGSPLTHAMGIGLHGPVSDDEFDRIEAVFFDRGCPSVFEFCPLADPSVVEHLAKRGYHPHEFVNALFREIGAEDHPEPDPGVTVGRAGPEEAEAWAAALSEGFAGEPNVPEDLLDLARVLYGLRLSVPYVGRFEGEVAGGGSLLVWEGLGSLSGTAVRPAFRKRGVHKAILFARLREAKRLGCDLVTMGALPGSGSHRNAERLGLRVAYTRVGFMRRPA